MSGKRGSMARMIVVICVVVVAACAGMAQARTGEWGGGGCGEHARGDFRKIARKLDLTDAQKAQAKTLFQANREVVKPVLASLRTERENLRALIHADTIDEAAIRAETVKIAGIQADLNVNRAKVGAQFRAILTPGQLATLKTLQQERGKNRNAPDPLAE